MKMRSCCTEDAERQNFRKVMAGSPLPAKFQSRLEDVKKLIWLIY